MSFNPKEYMVVWRAKNKDAQKAYRKARYAANRETVLAEKRNAPPEEKAKYAARSMAYYHKHKGTIYTVKKREYHKKWSQKNREKLRAYCAAYRAQNRDKCKAYGKKWDENNKTHRFIKSAAWRKRVGVDYWKSYYLKNHEKMKCMHVRASARRRALIAGSYQNGTAENFYKFVRGKKSIPCYYCGVSMAGTDAHIDHVIAVSKQGNHSSENLCASCPTCNLRKNNKAPSEIRFLPQPLLNL